MMSCDFTAQPQTLRVLRQQILKSPRPQEAHLKPSSYEKCLEKTGAQATSALQSKNLGILNLPWYASDAQSAVESTQKGPFKQPKSYKLQAFSSKSKRAPVLAVGYVRVAFGG